MTVTALPTIVTPYAGVGFDLYRDIHKGIRSTLFAVTTAAGCLDPTDDSGWGALTDHVLAVQHLLHEHACNEDAFIDPVLEVHAPDLAAAITADHRVLDGSLATIIDIVQTGAGGPMVERRQMAHSAYLGLGAFTSAYLHHQAIEETEVMPLLEGAIGVDAVRELHRSIISSIPPGSLMQALSLMLPAMNIDDRAELLGGMRATAPAPAFAAVVSLTRSVLAPADFAALNGRLDLG